MDRPLEGIRIIDMSTHGACPSCTKILSNWGAEVIKIEALTGDAARKSGQTFGAQCMDGCNPHFDMLNAGKKSIALNTKSVEGKGILDKLLKSANAFVTNVRTASLGRMGLDWDTFHETYPNLVWAHLSGFGEKGPFAGNAGFDTVAYYARTGAMIDFSENGAIPINAPFAVGDMSAGASLAGGISAALLKQIRTGEGSKVTISLYGQSIWAHSCVLQGVYNGNKYPKTRTAARVPMNNSYPCSDGEWIYVSVLQFERYFETFMNTIGRADLIDNPKFNSFESATTNNAELISIIEEAFKTKTRDEWNVLLKEADIAFDNINHLTDIFDDPQTWENNMMFEYNYANGEKNVIVNPPVMIGDFKRPEVVEGPVLSQHSADILKGIGYSDDEVEAIYESGAVGRPAK